MMRGDNNMTGSIDNTQDVIDSRDVIARIEELEGIIADEEISEDNGAEPQIDENGKTKESFATCGECGKTWNDALITGRTPAPSARCPYENIHEEIAELKALQALADEASGYAADWQYGEALIRDSYFKEYAQQLADEIGAVSQDASWPNNCIDRDEAARQLQQDYTEVDFDGVAYWIR
jgi:hypothetical protein